MRNSQESAAIKVAIFFGCTTVFLAAAQVGLPLKGIQLNPALGNVFLVLAQLSLLGLLASLGWIFIPWIRNPWAGFKRRWPFALARTVRHIRTELRVARDRNEQLELENKNLRTDLDAVGKELGLTKHEKAELRQEIERLRYRTEQPPASTLQHPSGVYRNTYTSQG